MWVQVIELNTFKDICSFFIALKIAQNYFQNLEIYNSVVNMIIITEQNQRFSTQKELYLRTYKLVCKPSLCH